MERVREDIDPIAKAYSSPKFECILKKRCQFPQVSSLSSLGPRPWIFRPRLLLSFRPSPVVSLCLSLFFSLFPRECDPFGVVATGVTLVGPPGGPRMDSRRATRTPEGVRSCARADVLLSFDTLDDAPRCCESTIPFALSHERAKEIGWPRNAEYYRYIAIDVARHSHF